LDLAAIDEREKVPADKQEHHRCEAEYQHGDNRHYGPTMEQHGEKLRIPSRQSLEARSNAAVIREKKPAGPRHAVWRRFVLEQQPDRDGRQGPRQSIRTPASRKHDGESCGVTVLGPVHRGNTTDVTRS